MIRNLRSKPFYLLLLPIFFLLHTVQENIDLIGFNSVISFFGIYCLTTAFTYGISFLFFRDYKKASIITILWMSFFFFFSAFHEFLKDHSPVKLFTRYSFVLPFSVLVLVLLFIYIKKTTKRFERFSILLNLLFIIYIVLDASILIWKVNNPKRQNISVDEFPQLQQASICDTCAKPDIYFLLFDEYAGSESLHEQFKFSNSLDSFLTQTGFRIQPASRANYNFTPFSMSSILNMAYLSNFNPKSATANDYVGCNYLIKNNRVTEFLKRSGYEIINYSVFDVQDKPALVQQFFLPQAKKVISERTFFNRINADIGWNLFVRFNVPINPKRPAFRHTQNNSFFIDLTRQTSKESSSAPRFVYAHLYLPHPPFFFDKNGKLRDPKLLGEKDYFNPVSYLGYLQYTNGIIKDLVKTIMQNNPKAVIILMSDHGYRLKTTDPNRKYHFNNLNAVYFPDKDYGQLYSDISGCNQFRVVFNTLFNQNFPLLKDSAILMRDKVNR